MKLGIIIIVMALFGCAKPKQTIKPVLTGKWVEMNKKTDTLIFSSFADSEMMILSRAKVIRNGILSPEAGAGLYEYNLLPNKIELRWSASSMGVFNNYYFSVDANKIVVANFYDFNASSIMQTFVKLK